MRMCQGSSGQRDINEHMRNSEPDKQYDAWLFFFLSLYVYLSYIFYFKESAVITEKQKAKQIQNKKKTYRNVEDKSLPILFDYVLPIRQSSFFFLFFSFQLVLNSHPYRLVSFIIKGREPPRSSPYLFTYYFFFLLLAKNKSLSSSSLK